MLVILSISSLLNMTSWPTVDVNMNLKSICLISGFFGDDFGIIVDYCELEKHYDSRDYLHSGKAWDYPYCDQCYEYQYYEDTIA
jgi:hypothetical protein